MECEVCMNGLCGASLTAGDYKKGWGLRSGHFANLCHKCGTAYEQLAFCELFHQEDTGWRECTTCGKRLHCGCIASSAFLELLDNGGVSCVSCSNSLQHNSNTSEEKPKETVISVYNHVNSSNFDKIMLTKLNDGASDNGQKLLIPSGNDDASRSPMKQEESYRPPGENSTLNGTPESTHADKFHKYGEIPVLKDVYGSLVQTNLTIGLTAPPGKPVFFPGTAVEERELNKSYKTFSYFQQGPWSRQILPKVPKSILSQGGMSSQIRVARPPVDGRVKNQLLPRYWPRITEEELQQISGDSNATVVPLFEKVLSASDAGRIGRLVLPKACAEAYFPPISQPEGLPLKIQDVKGKEWVFQFRFWPNNNSRMYVLEGVTPCIQSMQLQAGDTVTFSRMEPEGKLFMGFRKASNSASVQGCTDSHLNEFSRNIHLPNGDVGWHTNEKKRSRNIGSKSKRLLIESQDALELKHTWEESQDMLFPASFAKPSTITIEDNEFEEYEEPPVFGKGSIFTVRSSGEQDQWAECDSCSKWRRLPAAFLLPPRWTCQDNVWNQSRATCLAPDELRPRELDNLLRLAKDFHRRKSSMSHPTEPLVATTGTVTHPTEPPVATTTKHPRHRPGCSCIVCIQPPSGKGKHNPTCICNVCMTVKRRFKTLMLRKKKRQSEHEAQIAQKNQLTFGPKEESEVASISSRANIQANIPESENTGKGRLDLNIHPHPHPEEYNNTTGASATRVSMMSLLQVANLPLETYLKQNGLTSLIFEQQASSGSQALPQETGETEGGDEEDTGDDENELQGPENIQKTSL